MPDLTPEQQAELSKLQSRVEKRTADPAVKSIINGLMVYLQECEQQLIALMHNSPPPPKGNIEFGSVLYMVHHDLPATGEFAWFFNWFASFFPPSKISRMEWVDWEAVWASSGVVAPDGTLMGSRPFEQLDKGWIFSSVLYFLTIAGEVPLAKFGATPYLQTITGKSTLRIALIGDWGTGSWPDLNTKGPATQIMQDLQKLNPPPDIVVHLGDTYYSGTGQLSSWTNIILGALGVELGVAYDWTEETDRLVKAWWPSPPPLNFTLNSNHEMYSGANGYFNVLGTAPFAKQAGTSYFALFFQDWVILGLDSGYFSDALLFMEGRLQSPTNTQQVGWISKLNLSGRKVIALSHHTGLTYDGSPPTASPGSATLYADLSGALGRDPDYWYWGHIHNGIVYTNKVSLTPKKQTSTRCRCLGHSGLPFGNAYYWLNQVKYNLDQAPGGPNPKIAYYAHTPLQASNPPVPWKYRVKNGFAVLTLSAGSIVEAFYEQGNPQPVWTLPREASAGI